MFPTTHARRIRTLSSEPCARHATESTCVSDPRCTWFDPSTFVFPIPHARPVCTAVWGNEYALERHRVLETDWGLESAARNRAYWREHNTRWLQTNNHTNDTNHTSPPPSSPSPLPPTPEPIPSPSPEPIPSPVPSPSPVIESSAFRLLPHHRSTKRGSWGWVSLFAWNAVLLLLNGE